MPVFLAKLMFSGMLPVALANFNAFTFAATIPITWPLLSKSGPQVQSRHDLRKTLRRLLRANKFLRG